MMHQSSGGRHVSGSGERRARGPLVSTVTRLLLLGLGRAQVLLWGESFFCLFLQKKQQQSICYFYSFYFFAILSTFNRWILYFSLNMLLKRILWTFGNKRKQFLLDLNPLLKHTDTYLVRWQNLYILVCLWLYLADVLLPWNGLHE